MEPYTQQPPYYAQWGEDRWLVEHMVPPARGIFVDIGAGDGVRGSNSLYFENTGWRGLCVDPDPRNHDALHRRVCTVRTCAVSARPGPQPFSLFQEKPSWSGLGHRGDGYTHTLVDCRPLSELLEAASIGLIDLLSLDVEGDELDVWDSFSPGRHRPSIVVIEHDSGHADRREKSILRHLGERTYVPIHRTPANLILYRTDEPSRAWRWRRGR